MCIDFISQNFNKLRTIEVRFSLLVFIRVACENRHPSERIENENRLLLAIQSTIDREEMITEEEEGIDKNKGEEELIKIKRKRN